MTLNTVLLTAYEDQGRTETLLKHLDLFHQTGVISLWHAGMVLPGVNWEKEHAKHLYNAHLVLVGLSANVLSNNRLMDEMRRALERQEQGLCIVVVLLFSPCLWSYALDSVPVIVLPRNHKAIASWRNQDDAYVEVLNELQAIIKRMSRRFLS